MLIVISGPSGVGKDTVLKSMQSNEKYTSLDIVEPRSFTTRAKRKSDGHDTPYIFVSDEEFDVLASNGKTVAETEIYGNKYATSRQEFESAMNIGKVIVKILDVNGAMEMTSRYGDDTIAFYLEPPDQGELLNRLRSRRSESSEELLVREEENKEESLKPIPSCFDYVLVVEDSDETADRILDIICSKNQGSVELPRS